MSFLFVSDKFFGSVSGVIYDNFTTMWFSLILTFEISLFKGNQFFLYNFREAYESSEDGLHLFGERSKVTTSRLKKTSILSYFHLLKCTEITEK